jgi:GNAT superfamily N-acetyltransferase
MKSNIGIVAFLCTCMIRVQPATREHIPIIQHIAFEVWPKAYGDIPSAAQLNYMLDLIYSEASLKKQIAGGHQFTLAYDDTGPVGFASFSETEPGIYKLQKLYVLSNQQGKGTSKLLVTHVLDAVTTRGSTALRLNVNRHNKAKAFYERFGFEVIKEEDIDIGNGYLMNDYVMEKRLNT